jgi:hypothetical protein
VQIIHLDTNENNSLTEEIESWKNGFGSVLRAEDRELFMKMIEDCNNYTDVINTKGELYTTELLFITLILEHQKMIKELIAQISAKE